MMTYQGSCNKHTSNCLVLFPTLFPILLKKLKKFFTIMKFFLIFSFRQILNFDCIGLDFCILKNCTKSWHFSTNVLLPKNYSFSLEAHNQAVLCDLLIPSNFFKMASSISNNCFSVLIGLRSDFFLSSLQGTSLGL